MTNDTTVGAPRVRRRGSVWLPVAGRALALRVPRANRLGTPRLLGWAIQPVLSGSMAPSMPQGSLAIVQPADPGRIVPGTTIVFDDPLARGRQVAHRVVRVVPGAPVRYETQGDANLRADPLPIPIASVSGVVGWNVPGLGTVVAALAGPPAVLLLVVLPLGLLLVTEMAVHRRRRIDVRSAG
jgi:signal peptidase